jgi:hypothetical protein
MPLGAPRFMSSCKWKFWRRATAPASPTQTPDLMALRRANARRYLREHDITCVKGDRTDVYRDREKLS